MTRKEIIHAIWKEREQQEEREGYAAAHDDTHVDDELAKAAAVYALGSDYPEVTEIWPFYPEEPKFKPDRRRDLIRAAALLVAELERLERGGR